MSSLKIYTYPNNWRVWKALVAAQYNNIDIELPAFNMATDLKTDAFKAKNPLQKVPVLETPQGCIFESMAIARYIAGLRTDADLTGRGSWETAKVNQWCDFISNEFEPARGVWLAPILGYLEFNQIAYNEAKKEVTRAMTILNDHLLSHTFMVGNHVTLADISLVCSLAHCYSMIFAPKFAAGFPNVMRYFQTCINQPEFSRVLETSKFEFCKEEMQAAKGDKKAAAPAAEKKEAAKPAAAASSKPKEEAAAKPAAGEHDDLLDDEDKPKMKKKNPLDDLPPSTMDLDTMKKLMFSQRPFLPDFFEKFWPQYDPSGYCWFTCDYNYDSDNKEYWKLGNSLGGFIQRSDACRKYAMGCIQATGPEDEEGSGPWSINGVWLFRGPTMIAEMKEENPDSEYYTWKQVDVSTEEGKKKVKEYMIGQTVNGKKVLDRRFFK